MMSVTTTEVRQRLNNNCQPEPECKLIGIDGNWYDVTHVIKTHPGGSIMQQFINQDATQVFHSVGHYNVLKHRKPVGTYKMPQRHSADEDFEKLIETFKEKGFYQTDWPYYYKKFAVVVGFLLATFYCIAWCTSWYMHYLGGVMLAMVWHQSVFIMHDLMHMQVFRDFDKDRFTSLFIGTMLFGMSSHWWQESHNMHHAFTNTVDIATRFVDPQMWEPFRAQNEKLFPLYKGKFLYFMIKIQHLTFIPFVILVGRIQVLLISYIMERNWYEWVAIVLHWVWHMYLLSYLPTWREVFIVYGMAALIEGLFHFQLILSHYCRPFHTMEEYRKNSWYIDQIVSNLNYETWWWLDWFYGGLNFHIEHHLFPKLARNNLREAGKYVREVCGKHGIQYETCGFLAAFVKTIVHLKNVKEHFNMQVY